MGVMASSKTSAFMDSFVFPVLITGCFFALNLTGVARASVWEFLPVMTGLIGTTMLKREDPLGHLVMFVSQILFLFYFLQLGLMGQFIFAAIWGILSLIGFYFWTRPKKKGPVIKPSFLNPSWLGLIGMGLGAIMYYGWETEGGIVGILDYATLYLGIMGQLIMMRKKVEGWIFWLTINVAAIALFIMSGSYLLVLRSIIYFPIYLTALRRWQRLALLRPPPRR